MSAAVADVVAVRVPERSWRSEARAVRAVWWREMIRFADDRVRIVTALIQPLLFLFVLAPGLQTLSAASTDGVDLTTFMFPGVLCMAMWFSAMISAASLVMDRELGFLREMMVAPVRRSSIVLGKCLGGTTIATTQGVILLALAGLVHVPYDPVLLLGIFGLQLLIAFTVTALGVMVATTVKQAQTFNSVMQVLVFPTVFLSGAMYPVSGLPSWLGVLNRLNPLTYAVDPMRRLVFDHLDISEAARHRLAPGVTWWGWPVPTLVEVGIVLALGLAMLAVAIVQVHADGVTSKRELTVEPAGRCRGRRRRGPYDDRMALALFAEIHVRDFQAAKAWYVQLLGESSFVAHDTEEVWELAENRSIAVEEQPENAGHGAVTVFVDDLDTVVDAIVARGIEPTKRETYDNGVRKVTFHDPDGNEIGFGGAPV